jgi:hypothetical protein
MPPHTRRPSSASRERLSSSQSPLDSSSLSRAVLVRSGTWSPEARRARHRAWTGLQDRRPQDCHRIKLPFPAAGAQASGSTHGRRPSLLCVAGRLLRVISIHSRLGRVCHMSARDYFFCSMSRSFVLCPEWSAAAHTSSMCDRGHLAMTKTRTHI